MINFIPPKDSSEEKTLTPEEVVAYINNQTFINSLAELEKNDIHNNPALEVYKLMRTFENTLAKNGPDSFNIMYVLFNSDYEPSLILEPRPYSSKDEMYMTIAEMAFSFSSFKGRSFILATDTTLTNIDQDNIDNPTKTDSLMVSFVTPESAAGITMPYVFNSNTNSVVWSYDNFSCYPIETKDPQNDNMSFSGPMTELLFIMSHIIENPFSINSLVNYYNFRDFPIAIPDESIAHKVTIEI